MEELYNKIVNIFGSVRSSAEEYDKAHRTNLNLQLDNPNIVKSLTPQSHGYDTPMVYYQIPLRIW